MDRYVLKPIRPDLAVYLYNQKLVLYVFNNKKCSHRHDVAWEKKLKCDFAISLKISYEVCLLLRYFSHKQNLFVNTRCFKLRD